MDLYISLVLINLPLFIFAFLVRKARTILFLNLLGVYMPLFLFIKTHHYFPFFTIALALGFALYFEFRHIFLKQGTKKTGILLIYAILGLLTVLCVMHPILENLSRLILAALLAYMFIKSVNIFYMRRNRLLTTVLLLFAITCLSPFASLYLFFSYITLTLIAFFNFMILVNYIKNLKEKIRFLLAEKELLIEYMEESSIKLFAESKITNIAEFINRIIFEMIKAQGYLVYSVKNDSLYPEYMGRIFPPLFPVSENVLKKEDNIIKYTMSRAIPIEEFYFKDLLLEKKSAIYQDITSLSFFSYLKNSPVSVKNLAIYPLYIRETLLGVLLVRSDEFYDTQQLSLLDTISRQLSSYMYALQMRDDLLEKKRIERELEMSHNIQFSLLPHNFPKSSEFEIFGKLVPAKEMGGDYFDIIQIAPNTYDLVVGDVSGKGIPAALLMVILRTLIKIFAEKAASPKQLLTKLNEILYKDINEDMFITLLYARFFSDEKRLVYASAGHLSPYHVLSSRELNPLPVSGIALGMLENIDSLITEYEISLEPGQSVFFYTDGVTEAKASSGIFFDESRLEQKLLSYSILSAKDMVEKMYETLRDFCQNTEQYDDITMLCLKIPERGMQ